MGAVLKEVKGAFGDIGIVFEQRHPFALRGGAFEEVFEGSQAVAQAEGGDARC